MKLMIDHCTSKKVLMILVIGSLLLLVKREQIYEFNMARCSGVPSEFMLYDFFTEAPGIRSAICRMHQATDNVA